MAFLSYLSFQNPKAQSLILKTTTKGQLISENFGVFKSPKKRTKFLKEFCPSL